MAVPTSITQLSTTALSNSPSGSDAIGTSLDDFLRSIQAILKQTISQGSDIASAATITPGDGNYFVVTGTTGIGAIGSTNSWNGREIALKFSGALTLTHSANLILPSSANITTASGDVATFVQEGSGTWRCTKFAKADGTPVQATPLDSTLVQLAAGNIGEEFTSNATSSIQVPQGTTAQRPTGAVGKIRYNTTLSTFEGYGASGWGAIGGGAAGGSTDHVFYENDQTVTTDYTITTNKNAMSAGPITVNSGVTVTVPSGSVWTIV